MDHGRSHEHATLCKSGQTMCTIMPLRVIDEEHRHWAGCETGANSALRRWPGLRDVRASAETLQIAVTIDPSAVSRAQVCARLE